MTSVRADRERPLQPPVEREIRVVLAIPVAAAIVAVQHARRRRDRLRRAPLHSHVQQQAAGQLGVGEEVHLVADVAIRRPVVQAQIVEVERPIGERVALVRVVVFVLGEHVVAPRTDTSGSSACARRTWRRGRARGPCSSSRTRRRAAARTDWRRCTSSCRASPAGRRPRRCRARCSSGTASGAMPLATVKSTYAAMLGMSSRSNADVGAEDARILVVAVEDADAGEERERAGRDGGRRQQVRPHRHVASNRVDAEVALLLDAVGRHGSDLAQHVLARVVEAGAAAQHASCPSRRCPTRTRRAAGTASTDRESCRRTGTADRSGTARRRSSSGRRSPA